MATAKQAVQARRHLDKRMADLGEVGRFAVPRTGWVRAVREALGMSARVLGQRLGVTGQAVRAMEVSELDGRIKLETLQRAAEAMGCVLVYALVPQTSLQQFVEEQAEIVARTQVMATATTMALEAQPADLDEDVVKRHAGELAATGRVWRDPQH